MAAEIPEMSGVSVDALLQLGICGRARQHKASYLPPATSPSVKSERLYQGNSG